MEQLLHRKHQIMNVLLNINFKIFIIQINGHGAISCDSISSIIPSSSDWLFYHVHRSPYIRFYHSKDKILYRQQNHNRGQTFPRLKSSNTVVRSSWQIGSQQFELGQQKVCFNRREIQTIPSLYSFPLSCTGATSGTSGNVTSKTFNIFCIPISNRRAGLFRIFSLAHK